MIIVVDMFDCEGYGFRYLFIQLSLEMSFDMGINQLIGTINPYANPFHAITKASSLHNSEISKNE
jgi:hypothetical protein